VLYPISLLPHYFTLPKRKSLDIWRLVKTLCINKTRAIPVWVWIYSLNYSTHCLLSQWPLMIKMCQEEEQGSFLPPFSTLLPSQWSIARQEKCLGKTQEVAEHRLEHSRLSSLKHIHDTLNSWKEPRLRPKFSHSSQGDITSQVSWHPRRTENGNIIRNMKEKQTMNKILSKEVKAVEKDKRLKYTL
jgi:hypothetical protein